MDSCFRRELAEGIFAAHPRSTAAMIHPNIASRFRRHRKSFDRRGGAVVELAICLPVLVLLLLATIEACTMLYVQQTLKTTAFEGARVGIVPGAEAVNVNFQCGTLLDDHNIRDYQVLMSGNPTSLDQGDWFTVTVEAEFGSNSLVGGWLYSGRTLTKSVSLRAE